MEHRIESKRLVRTVTFSRPGSGYIFVDLNDKPGTLGKQICSGGRLTGSTISYYGHDDAEFARVCSNWYRSYCRSVCAL